MALTTWSICDIHKPTVKIRVSCDECLQNVGHSRTWWASNWPKKWTWPKQISLKLKQENVCTELLIKDSFYLLKMQLPVCMQRHTVQPCGSEAWKSWEKVGHQPCLSITYCDQCNRGAPKHLLWRTIIVWGFHGALAGGQCAVNWRDHSSGHSGTCQTLYNTGKWNSWDGSSYALIWVEVKRGLTL